MWWIILLVIAILTIIVAGLTYSDWQPGEWNRYAICPCGWKHKAPFGDAFHVHIEVCPKCGVHKREWRVKTGRYTKDGFEER